MADKYNPDKMTSGQRARISEIRRRFLDMGVEKTKDELLKIAKESFPGTFAKKMEKGGPTAPVMPKEVRKKRNASAERTERPSRKAYKEMGFTDAELKKMGMKDGGEAVPAKFKGFSKLPEGVQQKMDPDLAQKYEKGGAVGSCRGMGAALRGGKFSGVK